MAKAKRVEQVGDVEVTVEATIPMTGPKVDAVLTPIGNTYRYTMDLSAPGKRVTVQLAKGTRIVNGQLFHEEVVFVQPEHPKLGKQQPFSLHKAMKRGLGVEA